MGPTNALALTAILAAGGRQDAPAPERAEPPPSLTVSGDAEVVARPDRAVVILGATAQAPSASAAQGEVSQVMQRALAALREAGVPEAAVQTVGISLDPVYSHPSPTEQGGDDTPRIVAYRASNSVRVELDDPSSIGEVIDAGIGAGANQLQGISFELRDDTSQRAEALRRAVESARWKAEALAGAAGVRLAAVRSIREGGVRTVAPLHRLAQAASFEAGTPVRAGQVRVSASVTLTYDVVPPEADHGRGEGR